MLIRFIILYYTKRIWYLVNDKSGKESPECQNRLLSKTLILLCFLLLKKASSKVLQTYTGKLDYHELIRKYNICYHINVSHLSVVSSTVDNELQHLIKQCKQSKYFQYRAIIQFNVDTSLCFHQLWEDFGCLLAFIEWFYEMLVTLLIRLRIRRTVEIPFLLKQRNALTTRTV